MKVAIIGAGGHGRVVLEILRSSGQAEPAVFLDADKKLHGREIEGLPVLGDITMLSQLRRLGIVGAIVAIGDNPTRLAYARAVIGAGIELVNAIHPAAHLASNARIGKNVVIAPGAIVCAHSVIGDSVILNTGAIIDHQSLVAEAAHICPGAKLAGHVKVQRCAFVGIGATVTQGLSIGQGAIVGAGAVVVQDVPAFATVVGVPARVIKLHGRRVGEPAAATIEM